MWNQPLLPLFPTVHHHHALLHGDAGRDADARGLSIKFRNRWSVRLSSKVVCREVFSTSQPRLSATSAPAIQQLSSPDELTGLELGAQERIVRLGAVPMREPGASAAITLNALRPCQCRWNTSPPGSARSWVQRMAPLSQGREEIGTVHAVEPLSSTSSACPPRASGQLVSRQVHHAHLAGV